MSELHSPCWHRFFLNDWHGNQRSLDARIPGSWKVRCGHCELVLGACIGELPVTEVVWSHDSETFFGSFCIALDPTETLQ